MSRNFEQQFESQTVERVRTLLDRVSRLQVPKGVSRYYAVDLDLCLRGGALLGALHMAASLLEIVVREMVIEYATEAQSSEQRSNVNLQRELEKKKDIGFKKLVEELRCAGLFDSKDAHEARQFYDAVRIPIHHGLPLRFVEANTDQIRETKLIGEIFGWDMRDAPAGMHDFEQAIEKRTLALIDTALGIIERNSK